MQKVTSKDGTTIAFNQRGQGPVVILVDGALSYHAFGYMERLSELLAKHFTALEYDRRGRGESGDTLPFALEREIEDLEALIDKSGGSASVFGISSGGCLALEAALKLGNKIKKLAMYEPPYNSDKADRPVWEAYKTNLKKFITANRRDNAVEIFLQLVGVSAAEIDNMRQTPLWPVLEALSPTLLYDATAIGEDRRVPVERAAAIKQPTLIINGTAIPFMLATAKELAKAIPHAQHRTLEGQSHDVDAQVLASVLIEFFAR